MPELRMIRWFTAVEFVDIAAPVPRRTAATTRQVWLSRSASAIATASTVSRPMTPARSVVLLGALLVAPRPEQTAASRRSRNPIVATFQSAIGHSGTNLTGERSRITTRGSLGAAAVRPIAPSPRHLTTYPSVDARARDGRTACVARARAAAAHAGRTDRS